MSPQAIVRQGRFEGRVDDVAITRGGFVAGGAVLLQGLARFWLLCGCGDLQDSSR
jgi:hypothetical protein